MNQERKKEGKLVSLCISSVRNSGGGGGCEDRNYPVATLVVDDMLRYEKADEVMSGGGYDRGGGDGDGDRSVEVVIWRIEIAHVSEELAGMEMSAIRRRWRP